ncbi:adenylosuccinate lyase [Oxyplasma meridianum]|uniref:Adenylosuccinate lyase n=1 Tax=Oxyplasma meridianum TaxID=3073602 RepID=A0AAX4NGP4_9ARCH
MVVSPLEYRYGRPEVKAIFDEDSRLKYLLKIEVALAQAESEQNLIPLEAFLNIKEAVDSGKVKQARIKEIEEETRHDMMALIRALTEVSGEGGKYVHFGVTSNDILDTATALQLRDFTRFLIEDIIELQGELLKKVEENIHTIMLGRTHGQHASPITFGLKMAVYLAEVNRHLQRVMQGRERYIAGKILGPVGTGASLGDAALEIQDRVMEILGIKAETGATQVVNRDRIIEFLSIINNIVTTLEKIATEIRNLQRTEIDEVSEYFDMEKQVGSSSMPNKVNPVNSENIVSLSRFIRSLIISEYEAAVTWHERDLTNSASERFVIPYASILTDYILKRMSKVISTLVIKKEKMLENLTSDPLVMGENIVSTLTENGVPRQDAHEMVRTSAMEAYKTGKSFEEILISNGILRYISEDKLKHTLDPRAFTGQSEKICLNIIQSSKLLLQEVYRGI